MDVDPPDVSSSSPAAPAPPGMVADFSPQAHHSVAAAAAFGPSSSPPRTATGGGSDCPRCFNVLGARFECPPRYSLIRPIGQGAYGIVCSAVDNSTGEKVAIKKIADILETEVDCKRTLREMRLLRHFHHENVIAIKDVYVPAADGVNRFNDVYTVTELMDTDLHQIITSNQELSDEHCQYFLYQILRALKHIHSASVLHRDLKPSNILVNGNCDIKICDFGLARVADPEGDANKLTAYVATRWYRAPENIILSSEYGPAVDVWSVGCVIGEILGRRPLFPGRDLIGQLRMVIEIIGTPSKADLTRLNHPGARNYIEQNLPHKVARSFPDLFPAAPPLLLDLMAKMLVFNPEKRITVEAALDHPYLADLHEMGGEPLCNRAFNFEFDREAGAIDQETLRRLVYDEVCAFHPELRQRGG